MKPLHLRVRLQRAQKRATLARNLLGQAFYEYQYRCQRMVVFPVDVLKDIDAEAGTLSFQSAYLKFTLECLDDIERPRSRERRAWRKCKSLHAKGGRSS